MAAGIAGGLLVLALRVVARVGRIRNDKATKVSVLMEIVIWPCIGVLTALAKWQFVESIRNLEW
jgi:hypothetical protein